MKMTEKMKTTLEEAVQKEGIELSDEQLDKITGGHERTAHEREVLFDPDTDYAALSERYTFHKKEPYWILFDT